MIENTGVDTWELVYSTAFIDSSSSSSNARYATGGDLDGDGNQEIIFVAGNGYNTDLNPAYVQGVYVFEHDGVQGSDNYGDAPATVGDFYGLDEVVPADAPSFVYAQNLEATDVDGDGVQELLVPANGPSAYDVFYVLSVNGTFEPGQAGQGFEAWTIELRVGPREDGNAFGGGSPSDVIAADLNGDGSMDISFHAWNNFNFFNATATGADTYELPALDAPDRFLRATLGGTDEVALFGGVAADIDGDGTHEIFYPGFFTKDLGVMDYDQDESVLTITPDEFAIDVVPDLGAGGSTIGDLDEDGNPEIIVGGSGYSAARANAGEPSEFIHVAEFTGDDPTDPASYSFFTIQTAADVDTTGFNIVFRDSAGIVTKIYETALAKQGVGPETDNDPIFPSGIAYLGDADGDGVNEVALSFQGVDDSLAIYDEVWNPDAVVQVFNTPVDSAGPGPALPGAAYEFSFMAAPGQNVSFATMFVQSNDLFYGPADTGLPLFDEEGNALEGDITEDLFLWDAGTELNEVPGEGPNQAPRQAGPDTGDPDTLTTVRLVNDGLEYPANSEVISATLQAGEEMDGKTMFTITIENVSDGTLGGGGTPLAPGVWIVHDAAERPLFEADADFPDNGLEALAEDGNPSGLLAALQEEYGYVRTVREKIAAPARAFMRVVAFDGLFVSISNDRVILPSDYKLGANYPNPFNPTTTFSFTLPIDKAVSVRVYDLTGRLVRTLVDERQYLKGTHEVSWDGRDAGGRQVASGTYLYTLEYGNFRQTRKMTLLK